MYSGGQSMGMFCRAQGTGHAFVSAQASSLLLQGLPRDPGVSTEGGAAEEEQG